AEEAYPYIAEWNASCQPPWTEKELRHKLADADKQPGERGYLRPGDPKSPVVNDRPSITITTQEHEVNEQAVLALARDTSIYQRGNMLVRIVRDGSPASKGIRRPFTPRIDPLPAPLLRERLAANVSWIKLRQVKEAVIEEP